MSAMQPSSFSRQGPTYDVVSTCVIIEAGDPGSWLVARNTGHLAEAVPINWNSAPRCYVVCARCGIAAGDDQVDPMQSWDGPTARAWADAHNADVHGFENALPL